MARPLNCRRIFRKPGCIYYKPAGVPLSRLKEVVITLDEFEAMRLVDLDGLYQEIAAKKMGISRQTLGRVVESARHKVAQALMSGMAMRFEGGNITMDMGSNGTARKFKCDSCKKGWGESGGTGRPGKCPKCGSVEFHRLSGGRGPGCCRRALAEGGKR